MKPGNGSFKYRNRKYLINWRGENAQHIAEQYINENKLHPFLHVQIQKLLQKAVITKKGRNIYGIANSDLGIIKIPFIIEGSLAHIKTAYKMSNIKTKAPSLIKGIRGVTHSKQEKWLTRMSQMTIDVCFHEEPEDAEEFLDHIYDECVKEGTMLVW